MKALLCGLASPGLLFPLIGLAERLREQGVTCVFATGLEFEHVLLQRMFRRISRGPRDGPSFEIARWAWPGHVAMQVKHIEYAVAAESPDVLIGNQLGLGAMIVAERLGIPLVVVGLASYLYPIPGAAYDEKTLDRKRFNANDILRYLNVARASFRYPELGGHESLLGNAFLVQSVRSAYRADESLPVNVHNVGAMLWEPPSDLEPQLHDAIVAARGGGREVYFVQMARSFNMKGLWRQVVGSLADEPATFIAARSRLDDEIGPVPANFVVRDMIPQAAILPHVDGVVTGGHTTSVLGAVVHGRPLLSIPTGSGTYDTADLCARLGNAVIIDGADVLSDAAVLKPAFARLRADDNLRIAADRACRAFSQHDPFGEAAAIVAAAVNATRNVELV